MAQEALSSGVIKPLGVPLSGRAGSASGAVKFTRFEAGAGATMEIVLGDVVLRIGCDIDPDQLAGIIGAVRKA